MYRWALAAALAIGLLLSPLDGALAAPSKLRSTLGSRQRRLRTRRKADSSALSLGHTTILGESPPPRVLLYWATKFRSDVVDVVIRNVDHLRGGGLLCDVLLGHYDHAKDAWLRRNGSWYSRNVRWGVNAKGWKVHVLKFIQKSGRAEGMDLQAYDWVWMLDEDIDVSRTNPIQLFRDAEATGSLIVGPAFVQRNASQPTVYEQPFYPMNIPRHGTRFRYVPMVEVIMPILRPAVLLHIFEGDGVLAPMHDWGIDHAWCLMVARSFGRDKFKACAIVDETGPIEHLNFRSTRDDGGKSATRDSGNKAVEWVRNHFRDDWLMFPTSRLWSWPGYESVPK